MLVLHFGMLHEADCEELSGTKDWVPFETVSDASIEGLEIERCASCLQ
ncbi:MAG: hypothetical protein ABEH90_06785 [Halolamina sp.]